MTVPALRIRVAHDRPPRREGRYVVYWMIAARRVRYNFALERAVEIARGHGCPLVILEPLSCDYRWASDRLHRFVLEGMAANARALARRNVVYHPYVEPAPGAGRGLLAALATRAVAVVTDEFPCHGLPRLVRAAAERITSRLEVVDSNGLLPLRSADRVFPTAHSFRRFLQRELPPHLEDMPRADPLRGTRLPGLPRLPSDVLDRWPAAAPALLRGTSTALKELPIDHRVAPALARGGARAAGDALGRFIDERLFHYAERRNEPEQEATSGLAPYLHFGHLSSHEIFLSVAAAEGWSPANLGRATTGARAGWWGMSASAEAFCDQLVTWRELGFNMAWQRDDYDRLAGLPDWARKVLAAHAADRREHVYTRGEFDAGATHDPLWNAAQTQLVREGRMHNYMRMLWGKKILEWSARPQDALATMIALNDRYAVDGRDPNSYSGIGWVLGRYDRAWGPRRPIFGTIRYMSSASTARKFSVAGYIRKYTP